MLNVENIVQMITQPWMVIIFVSTIFIVAARPFYQSIFSIRAVNNDITQAINILASLGKNKQDEFYAQFKTVNSQISKIRGLSHTWHEFVDSMYFESINTTNPHKKVYLSHRPAYYFNRESVLGTRLNLSQFFAYPNYLIGIGLTFTFIGLAAALHVAQAGLASGAEQQALKDLLAVASIKFISSIAGIFCSLVISAIQRVRVRIFQQKLTAFCDMLEECSKYKSAEKLLHDSFNEQSKQTVILSDMAKNIAISIKEVLSTQLSASVNNALQPLTKDINILAQNFAGGSETALHKMLEAFLNELRKSSNDGIQALIDNVAVVRNSLNELNKHIDSAGSHFDISTRTSAQNIENSLSNFANTFSPIHESIRQFSQSLSTLETITAHIQQAGNNLANASEDNKKSANDFSKSMSNITQNLSPIGALLPQLLQSLETIKENAQSIKTAGDNITTTANNFKEATSSLENSSEQLAHTGKILNNLKEIGTTEAPAAKRKWWKK